MRDARVTQQGRLSLVATPIGNLEDVTLRALRVLREADAVLAEDTRRTRTLLTHHGIATRVRRFDAHASEARVSELVAELAGGAHLALVTDAGTPGVSDPGAELAGAAARAGVVLEAIPGASAPLAALVASGFALASFRFVGFLPRSGGRRRRALGDVLADEGAVALFEAPGRIAATLADLAELAPERPAAVCRELTKLHEEIARGSLRELAQRFEGGALGEITLVLGPTRRAVDDEEDETDQQATLDARVDALLDAGVSPRDAAARLAREAGVPKRDAYQRVLARGSKRDAP